MDIRQKITSRFAAIVAFLLLFSLLVIYFSFDTFRQEEFRQRLSGKARSIGQLIAETDHPDRELLRRIEINNPTSLPRESVVVLNRSGEVLFHLGEDAAIEISETLIQKVISTGELHFQQDPFDVFALFYEGQTQEVLVFCSAEDVFGISKLHKLRLILIAVFLFSIVLVYFLGRMFAARALNPISDVINQVNELDISSMDTRVQAGSGADEIARLADTFNHLLDRLESAIQLQKDFIANSSHELRTPLTVITGQLDVTLLKDRTNDEYKAALISVLEEIKRLNSLTNRLLILSRAGTEFNFDRLEEVRIDDILWKARAEVIKRFPDYSVNISFDESISGEHHFNVAGNDQLLKTAFINLIENGCKYSEEDEIDIRLMVSESTLEVIFSDKGIGIPEEELELIFQPFYRGSNVSDNRGHGIGLSLVDRIVNLHKGQIKVLSGPGKGSEFRITIPLL